jgi:isochorismate hydrolase
LTTESCVAQTAIVARERELKVSVVVDACATVSRDDEKTALGYLVDVVWSSSPGATPSRAEPRVERAGCG